MWPRIVRPWRCDGYRLGAMHLMERHKPCARRNRLNRAPPVFGDRLPVVVRAQTYVQPREQAFRHAATSPEKAVRHAAKRFGANYLDSIRHSSTPPVGNAAGIAQSGAVTASALKSTPISSGEVSRLTSSSMESARGSVV